MKTAESKLESNGNAPPPAPAAGANLPADSVQRLEKLLSRQWKRYRKRLKTCQKAPSEEGIHATRVEARRLLATVELLAGFVPAKTAAKVHRAVKGHLDNFDELRDTQVQLPVMGKLLRRFEAARPFYVRLLADQDRYSKLARKGIRKAGTARLRKLIAQCHAEARARRKACSAAQANRKLLGAVNRAFGQVTRLRDRIDPARTETIHRVRVAFKKFRYMAETLADYLPGGGVPPFDAMHRYQTSMGEIQDAEVLIRNYERFLEEHAEDAEVADQLRQELARRRERLIAAYLRGADEIRGFWPRPSRRGARDGAGSPPAVPAPAPCL